MGAIRREIVNPARGHAEGDAAEGLCVGDAPAHECCVVFAARSLHAACGVENDNGHGVELLVAAMGQCIGHHFLGNCVSEFGHDYLHSMNVCFAPRAPRQVAYQPMTAAGSHVAICGTKQRMRIATIISPTNGMTPQMISFSGMSGAMFLMTKIFNPTGG